MFPLSRKELESAMGKLGINDIADATIRQISALASFLEEQAGEKMIHLETEREVLRRGIANQYPNIAGVPRLKENGSRFLKAFLDIDVPSEYIIPTVGSMQGGYALMLLLAHRDAKRDTMLFINPGFPAQRYQAKILGLKEASFDIYSYRGKALEAKLEEFFAKGNITAILYGTPNNPAWINLTEEELEIIGRLCTKYNVIAIEDLAYVGMDFRTNFGEPYKEPFVPTVAKFTDNYVLMVSASKIFSYAGQRIAMICFSPKVADTECKSIQEYFGMPTYLKAFVFGVLYALSSGTAHSAQHAMATMLGAAVDGRLNFVEDCREYERLGGRAKECFLDNGFHIIYAKDGDQDISDGFFFTSGYKDMSSAELQAELLRYGIASISLPSTGSEQNGLRVCVSMLKGDEMFDTLNERLEQFSKEH